MSAKSEYDAAYFTLLRAIEERDGLLRYREFLEAERARLDQVSAATREGGEAVPERIRRPVDRTAKQLLEAVGRRRVVVLDELGRMDKRLAQAEAFVEECEADVASLRP
ncbi:MAG TPA: hypothetical protein VNU01_12050 [Egibacteraceae bacterium]|nr:hypothetical protein [Egibacteraceae bacterium]